ncbi:hypothetical protein V2I01_22180 [Micromonospora sp. BRA006-A]|nr:hypothetical protein [Micromonospora sp. BRA006-A]
MGLDAIKAGLPEYAKDIRLNLGSTITTSTLKPEQAWGTALACAVAARNPVVLGRSPPRRPVTSRPRRSAAKAARRRSWR